MKRNKKELDVDFIGGLGTLTEKEAQMISAFIKSEKAKRNAIVQKPVKRKKRVATT
ncbi:MAG: hypothetical protein JWO03_2235 [Bacteroidetes bacterium]|nr:hypothetical protein [Bacteroidota bacterium]